VLDITVSSIDERRGIEMPEVVLNEVRNSAHVSRSARQGT
jgi:hypothetical protein